MLSQIPSSSGNFPGGPVVKTLCSQCEGHGLSSFLNAGLLQKPGENTQVVLHLLPAFDP